MLSRVTAAPALRRRPDLVLAWPSPDGRHVASCHRPQRRVSCAPATRLSRLPPAGTRLSAHEVSSRSRPRPGATQACLGKELHGIVNLYQSKTRYGRSLRLLGVSGSAVDGTTGYSAALHDGEVQPAGTRRECPRLMRRSAPGTIFLSKPQALIARSALSVSLTPREDIYL
jgi:hypothetical protein